MINHHRLGRLTLKHILPQLRSGGLESLQRNRPVKKVQRRQFRGRRQLPSGQEISEVFLQQWHLKITLVMLQGIVLGRDMSPRLHMIRRKARLLGKIRVQANVPSQIHHVNQKLLPRS